VNINAGFQLTAECITDMAHRSVKHHNRAFPKWVAAEEAVIADPVKRQLVVQVGAAWVLPGCELCATCVDPSMVAGGDGGCCLAVTRCAVRLDLPPQWRVHNALHVALVKPDARCDRSQPEPSPVHVEGDAPVFEVEQLLDVRRVRKGRKVCNEYLVK
jgi:hypothetical protein